MIMINGMMANKHVCFRYQDKRTDEKYINRTSGQAKRNMSKINSYITIYQDKISVDEYKLQSKQLLINKTLIRQTGHEVK